MQPEAFQVVEHRDPAIDREAMGADFEKYKTSRDFKLLKFIPGLQPMVFTLKEISQGLMFRFVMKDVTGDDEPGPEHWSRAFACAVQSVANIRQAGGMSLPDENDLARYDNGILKDEALDRFEFNTICEIGVIALTRSRLALTTDVRYPLPRSCQEL